MEENIYDFYYEITSTVMDHIELMMCAVCFCLLCRGFFRKKSNLWIIAFTYFTSLVVQYHIPVYMGGTVAHISSLLVSIVLEAFLEKKEASKQANPAFTPNLQIKVYLMLIFFSVYDLSRLIALEFYILTTQKLSRVIYEKIYQFASYGKEAFYLYVISAIIMYMIEFLLIITLVLFINRAFYDKDGRYEWKEIGILLIPSVAGYTVHRLSRIYGDFSYQETGLDILNYYDSYPMIATLLIIFYIATLAVIVVELYLFQSLRKRQEEEKERVLLHNQMQDMRSHIVEVERIYTGIRGVRHDLNNHMHIVKCLLEQGEYTQAQNYLDTMQETMEHFDFAIKTGNAIMDVIINEKYQSARQENITFQSEFYFAEDIQIDVFDIAIILNNILDNAFEAVCKSKLQNRFISLHSARKKNAYLITLTNSFDGTLSLDGDGLPKSDKKDERIHGLGLKNVKTVVEKYYGTLAIEQEDMDVVVTVMLMIKE